MSTLTSRSKSARFVKPLLLMVVLAVALWFIITNALQYFGFDPDTYGRWWTSRLWLFGHILGGILALVIGPFQFIPAIRNAHIKRHRLIGKVYLVAILVGSICSIVLSLTTAWAVHWTWGIALLGLGIPWLISALMAYRAIRLRRIGQHRDWMIRSYVITFGFVMFRILNDELFNHIGNFIERGPTFGWLAWAIPLFIAEVCIQWNKQD